MASPLVSSGEGMVFSSLLFPIIHVLGNITENETFDYTTYVYVFLCLGISPKHSPFTIDYIWYYSLCFVCIFELKYIQPISNKKRQEKD